MSSGPNPMFRTKIGEAFEGEGLVRGYKLSDLIENSSIAEVIYLLLRGELPSPNQEKMINALIVSASEHGVRPPSIMAARIIANCGVQFQAAVAGGILALGDHHGGAIDGCMKLLQDGVLKGKDLNETARDIVDQAQKRKERLLGFGHRLHKVDPRTVKLFEMGERLEVCGDHSRLTGLISEVLSKRLEREMPVNVDGAIAAILCDMGFDWRVGKGFFILGRACGIVGHVFEEIITEKPFAHQPSREISIYEGLPERSYPNYKG